MATEIGIVKTLIGTAVAIDSNGSERNLLAGDKVFADEVIATGASSAIEIEFSDGSLMDLGRNSQALLDAEVFDPQQVADVETETEADIAALQQAILDGQDPLNAGEDTAAGSQSKGGNEGVTTVVLDYLAPIVEVTSGFETNGVSRNNLDDNNRVGERSSEDSLTVNQQITTSAIAAQDNNDADLVNLDISSSFKGSSLTYTALGLPLGLSIEPSTGIISGVLDRSASQLGPYNVSITAGDGINAPVTLPFVWSVANPAPNAGDDSATLDEDTRFIGSVTANDNDPDGDAVSYSLNNDVSNGVLVFNNDGSYSYTPSVNFVGTDTFTYTITDADGATDTATVTLTINPLNDPTITAPDTGNTDEDATLTVTAANGVLSNDSDVDDTLSIASFTVAGDAAVHTAGDIVNIAGVGTLQINGDGSYEFIPAADYNGAVPVASYTTNTGAVDTLSLTIAAINDAPVAAADAGSFNEDQLADPLVPQTGSGNLLDGLTDVDDVAGHVIGTVSDDGGSYQTIALNGSSLIKVGFTFNDENGASQTVQIPVRVDADGEYHVSQSALLNAIPEGNVATGSFFYQIDDGHTVNNLSAPQEFTITVNGENDAPEFNVTSLENDGDIPVIVKLSGDNYNAGGQDAPRFIVSVDGAALNGGIPLTVEELRSYRIDSSLGTEPRETSWEYITFNVPAGTSSVAIAFINDAWEGGSDNDGDGYSEDRNLIIDYVNVGGEITGTDDNVTVAGGTTLQAEDPSVSTYITSGGSNRSGNETMAWSGTMTFNVANAVNNAVPTDLFQTERFGEDALSSQASVTGTVNLLEGVSDSDDIASVITVGTVNGNATGVGSPFNVNLTYDDGSGPQVVTVQITVAADGSYQISNTAVLDALPDGVTASGTFQFQAQDDSGALSETQTFTVNVLGADDASVLIADTASTNEDMAIIVDAASGVLSNDSDVDNALSVAIFTVGGTTYSAGDVASLAGVGTLQINGDGSYEFIPAANYSGAVPVASYTTNTGASDSLTLTINPVADAPTLVMDIDDLNAIPASTGLTQTVFTSFEGAILPSDTLELKTDVLSGGTTTVEAQPYRAGFGDGGNANKFEVANDVVEVTTGLVYLEAGSNVSFSGYMDDSFLIELGGKTLINSTGDAWGTYDTSTVATVNRGAGTLTTSGNFIAAQSGYYTLEIYIYNHAGPGGLAVNVTIDGVTTPLSSSDLSIYADSTSIGQHGVFQDLDFNAEDTDGGVYPVNGFTYTINIDASLTDVDGSETLSGITLAGIPTGSSITTAANGDGTYNSGSVTLSSDHALSATEINAITGSVTSTDGASTATTTTNVKVDLVGPGDDALLVGDGSNDILTGGTGDDIFIGGAGDDILSGSGGNDIFIWNDADVGTPTTPAHDEITDFDANNDVLNLADLLSDGSHTIEGMEIIGGGPKHLQLNIKDAGGNVVQEIELHGVSTAGTTATQVLDDLLSTGAVNDGI